MLKKEIELEEKFNLLEQEVKVLGENDDKLRLDIEEAVDSLKLEIECVKTILKELVPNFDERYSCIKNNVVREVDPERLNRK